MSKRQVSRRGQPLLVYGLLILGWVGLRSVFWDSPLGDPVAADPGAMRAVSAEVTAPDRAADRTDERPMMDQPFEETPWRDQDDWRVVEPADRPLLDPVAFRDDQASVEFSDASVSAGHQLMWMAAMAHFPMPKAFAQEGEAAAAAPPNPWLPLAKARGQKRWSLDAWVFLREDSGSSISQPGVRPSYGRSQQGAVIRYRLADLGGREPSLYARYTRALAGERQTDLAAGVGAKPFAALPIRAHAELRASRINGRTDWRPAAFVTAGVYEQLPRGVVLRGYGQAGYVGGDFATAFVDGQIVADREVAKFDLGKLGEGRVNLGAGAWAGAQKGAERVDVGPSANVVMPIGEAPIRLSVDYRFRVAGDAAPESGPAVTLSTGF
ncbi:hypothetical protein [Altererythrobacter sp. MF3-039]|uniref:hypothetical protein n=1 Tax=Altererythrobacter sp. MF3-039 TaxID=3252901 RepID=UPI00390C8025